MKSCGSHKKMGKIQLWLLSKSEGRRAKQRGEACACQDGDHEPREVKVSKAHWERGKSRHGSSKDGPFLDELTL